MISFITYLVRFRRIEPEVFAIRSNDVTGVQSDVEPTIRHLRIHGKVELYRRGSIGPVYVVRPLFYIPVSNLISIRIQYSLEPTSHIASLIPAKSI